MVGSVKRRRNKTGWLVGAGVSFAIISMVLAACSTGSRRAAGPRAVSASASVGNGKGEIHLHQAVSRAGREGYAGSAACTPCHQEEAAQLSSPHARTLARVDAAEHAARFNLGAHLFDPVHRLTYGVKMSGDRCVLTVSDGAETHEVPAEYAFGSGVIGVTYVTRRNDASAELRLTHYTAANRWDFTPSQGVGARINSQAGQVLDPRGEETCFRCHTTALVKENGRLDLERSILGVGCESCHGPGKAHIKAVEAGEKDSGMTRLSDLRDRVSKELCGHCHRAQAPPGAQEEYLAVQLPRLQGLALARTACFTKGKVSCVTCHDPHRDSTKVTRAQYNAKCVSCHGSAEAAQVQCPSAPRGDCVSCHMPAQDVGMPTGVRFRTHWIKVWREAARERESPTAAGPGSRPGSAP
jgi:predicted CXXCH cytochrome family protein